MSDPQNDPLDVSAEFIEENKHLKLGTTSQKSGGPYSRGQRRKRRQEVFKLHFEQGLPAIKIADLMKINRNTINDDIKRLYNEMISDLTGPDFHGFFAKQVVRLETQRARLASYLADAKELEQRLAIERQLADVDFRLASMMEKFKYGELALRDTLAKQANIWAEKYKLGVRFTSLYELYKISQASGRSLDKLRAGLKEPDEESDSR